MARIVLACWGSYGDLFPYIGVAIQLRAAGHTPIVAAPAYYRDLVEREDVGFHPVRPDVDPADTAFIRRVMDPRSGSEALIAGRIVPTLRDSYHDLDDVARGADLIVSHPVTFAAPMVASKRQLPWVSTVLSPMSFFSVYDFPALPAMPGAALLRRLGPWTSRGIMKMARRATDPWMTPVHALRSELGLPPAGNPLFEGQFSPHGTLAMFPRVLGEPQQDWPARTQVTGAVFYNGAAALPEDLAAFLDHGEPPIVFTLGSSAVGVAGSFYEESAKAAAILGRRAVLLVGRDPANRPSTPLPPGVLAVEFAPHQLLFPRAAAVVHQGGIGTTSQALRSGRPMLVVPYAHDQPDNAFRVRHLGVARVVYPARYQAPRVARALKQLLDDETSTARAVEIGELVRGEDGGGAACRAISGLVGA